MKNLLTTLLSVLLAVPAFSQRLSPTCRYTFEAVDNKVEGEIKVLYFVKEDGNLVPDSVRLLKGLGYGLDEIVVENLKSSDVNLKEFYAHFKASFSGGYQVHSEKFSQKELPAELTAGEWAEYYAIKGNKLLEADKTDEARKSYETALRRNPKNSRAHYGLAKIYETRGDVAKAKTSIENAKKYDK